MLNKKHIVLLISVFIVFVLLIYFLTRKQQTPKLVITDVTPLNQSENVEFYPSITISLGNNPELFNLLKIISEPSFEFSRKIVNQSIILNPIKSLKPSTKYTLTIRQKDITEPLIQWSFTTRTSPNNLDVTDKIQEVNEKYYPLLEYLPPESKNFKAYYTNRLALRVMIFSQNVEIVKQEVLSWIKSKQIDPSTHQIMWVEMIK